MGWFIGCLLVAAWLVGVSAYDRLIVGDTKAGVFAAIVCLVLLVGALALIAIDWIRDPD